MIPLVSARRASDLDREVRDGIGVPEAALMENAAAGMESVLAAVPARPGADGSVTALAGRGNNAGDALTVLRRIAFRATKGKPSRLTAILASGEPSGLAAAQLRAARNSGVRVLDWGTEEAACRELLGQSSVILDGIAGTGLSGALRPPQAALVEAANESGTPVAALDVPSGAWDDVPEEAAVIRAAATLCVEPRKACLYRPALRPFAGVIIPISGVFPGGSGGDSSCRLLEPSDLADLVPSFRPEAHKYERGFCRIFAGSRGASGAAILAARGASAGGAGLVCLHVRPDIWPIAASALQGEMVQPLPEDPSETDLGRAGAAVAGPGWGKDGTVRVLLRRLWDSGLPLVLDADALDVLRDLDPPPRAAPTILTPHPGEAARLSGQPAGEFLRKPEERLAGLAGRWGAVVLLKSCVTWIAGPDGRTAVYDGMDASLAVGGSGDVLAGIAGALLSRGLSGFDAACASVLAHGVAGKSARSELGNYGADALPGYAARVLGG